MDGCALSSNCGMRARCQAHTLADRKKNTRRISALVRKKHRISNGPNPICEESSGRITEEEFVDHLKAVIDLDAIQNLSASEVDNFFDAAQYLVDYLLLVRERKGMIVEHEGAPVLNYRGPYIQNILTNQEDGPSDFDQLDTLGVGGADKYFGG